MQDLPFPPTTNPSLAAAVMATARTTPSPEEYTENLVAYMDTTATGRSLLRASVTDNTPVESRADQ